MKTTKKNNTTTILSVKHKTPTQQRWDLCIVCQQGKPQWMVNLAALITCRDKNASWNCPYSSKDHNGICPDCRYALEHIVLADKIAEEITDINLKQWQMCLKCIDEETSKNARFHGAGAYCSHLIRSSLKHNVQWSYLCGGALHCCKAKKYQALIKQLHV